ncbi:tetratricopeptide repeat protein [Ahrensia sp. R2A130]|uniref:tetratricopeptide repeat protein n=1 Tax=Ahrensia sp. R2A130 TaxID=744979 RepID=UPI0001E0B4E0|nr:tetratricopeptide repeat protein [Ahrensia sp. R2A130]EFL88730.1 Tol-Pal system YbgF [Ahrensia sp. R2A130]
MRLRLFLLASLVALPVQASQIVPPAQVGNSLPVINVQSADSFRVNELEEQIRQLNGRVEELNFILLQLQEKVRKMEEDNELRFQEIEDKQGNLGGDDNKDVASTDQGASDSLGKPSASAPETSGERTEDVSQTGTVGSGSEPRLIDPTTTGPTTDNGTTGLPPAPRAPGTITFDENGNVKGSVEPGRTVETDDGAVLPPVFGDGTAGAVEASQYGATPDEVLAAGREQLDGRNYPDAQKALAAHILAWPDDPRSGEAYHYLGQAMFWQRDYYQAAEMHLKAHNDYPQAPTAADNLLGLGLSLAGLNQREVACATYAEVLKQYPDAKNRLGDRVKDEQAAAKCS